jgi:predicted ABC-type ATPase
LNCDPPPQLWIIAGPNGAGKTTLVTRRLRGRLEVVNPDDIAAALPRIDGRLDERRAGEEAVRRREALLSTCANLAIETTLAGASAIRFMRRAAAAGYKVTLVYVGLDDAALSAVRVAGRVLDGGHDVPADALERRYPDSLRRLSEALTIVDRAYLLDNSGRRRRLLLAPDAGRDRFRTTLPTWAAEAVSTLSLTAGAASKAGTKP